MRSSGSATSIPAERQHPLQQPVDHLVDVLLLHERHLQVELRELGLAVGAEVLVAEAAGDLEVALVPADHQQLLEELRRLRQRVPRARLSRLGTRKSRAPSGVERVRIGVSTSRKPSSER